MELIDRKAPWKMIKWTEMNQDVALIIIRNINNQQTHKIRKKITIFQSIDLKIEIQTNLTEVLFLDVTFSLERNTYRPYRKPNDNITYINTS